MKIAHVVLVKPAKEDEDFEGTALVGGLPDDATVEFVTEILKKTILAEVDELSDATIKSITFSEGGGMQPGSLSLH